MTKNEDRINKLFKELVPETGKADSLAGEMCIRDRDGRETAARRRWQ